MVDPLRMRRASFRASFTAIAFALIFVRILPFTGQADRLPAPDILTIMAFAWILRRPDYLPVWLVAAIALLADVLFMRPPGLWALATVLGTEFLRRRSHLTVQQPFPVEWLLASMTLAAMYLGEALILALLMVPQPSFWASLLELVATVLTYPLVVVATAFVFGVRPPSPSERDAEARL